MLTAERPADGILAEEGAGREGASGRRWVIDPLDGTTNFLYGFPVWCISIALEDADGGLVAVVHDPMRGETFRAQRGAGSTLNHRTIAVRSDDAVATALVATGFGYDPTVRARQAETLRRVLPRLRDIRRPGSAALDLAWVAAGRLDGYFERGLQPWDLAAGALLITEAGGALGTFGADPAGLVAANRALLPKLQALIAE